jgi:acyl-CoA synthetase (NDP forming)
VSKKKPIIALKSGRSEHGARAAQSHTGSLVGRDEVYDAVFRQSGVIRVEDIEEMEDVSLAFWRLPAMRGRRMAIMAWAGSTAVFASDACEKYGLDVPQLSATTIDKLRRLSPPAWLPLGNPLDIWSTVGLTGFQPKDFRAGFKTMLEALLEEEGADAVLVIIPDFLYLYDMDEWDISQEVQQAADSFGNRPIVVSIFGPRGPLTEKLERIDNIAVYSSCERGVRALSKMWQYTAWLRGQGATE